MAEAQQTAGPELPKCTQLHGGCGETSYTGSLLLFSLVPSKTKGPGLRTGETEGKG